MELTGDLLPIGRFARLSGLTVKALRHYDEIRLLEPAWTDPQSGYRWYALEQTRVAEAICRLRRLELPLEEIRDLLQARPAAVRERLIVHRARLEGRAVETRRILAELDVLIEGKEALVPEPSETRIKFELTIADVAEQQVLFVTEHVHVDEMSRVVPRGIAEVHGYLTKIDRRPLGPPICICPFPDERGMLEAEMAWPVEADVEGGGRVEAKILPAVRAVVLMHTGPYEELSRSYRLLAEVMERNGLQSAGDPREIYITDPEEVPDPNDHETRIVWPIGPEGELDASGDVFRRRVPS